MLWFNRLFPAVMILFPALFAHFMRIHPSLGRADQARRLQRRLWIATLVVLGLFAVTRLALAEGGGSLVTLGFGLGGFFALHFGYAMSVLAAKNPGWSGPHGASTTRSAELRPRPRSAPVPRSAWAVGWLLAAGSLGMGLWLLLGPASSPLGWMALGGTVFWLGFGPLAARSAPEPEPVNASAGPELTQAYEALRCFRSRAFFGLGLAGLVVFLAGPAATLWVPATEAGRLAVWTGAGGGGLLGLAGAAFGVVNSMRRARVYGLCRERDEGSEA